MVEVLLSPLVVFLVLAGWVGVQQLYARFQARHPQLGPFRDSGGGACGHCHCAPRVTHHLPEGIQATSKDDRA